MSDKVISLVYREVVPEFRNPNCLVMLDPNLIGDPPDNHNRIEGRNFPKNRNGAHLEVADLSAQLDTITIFSPLLVLEREKDEYIIVSGLKRLEAARESNVSQIPCFVVNHRDLIAKICSKSPEFKALAQDIKENYIAEAFQNIVYSDSEHSSRLKGDSILAFFRKIRDNHNYRRDDFRKVMKRIGLKHRDKGYRTAHRIWRIACSDEVIELLDLQKVKMRIFKKDSNMRVMERPIIAQRVKGKIESYCNLIATKRTDDEQDKPLVDCKAYDDKQIEQIIRDTEFAGHSKLADKVSHSKDYRNPKYKCRIVKGVIQMPSSRIDLNNQSHTNIALVLEALYKIDQVKKQLEGFVNHIMPDKTGETIKNVACVPKDIEYGKNYYEFVKSKNMERYANVFQIAKHLKLSEEPLYTDEQLKEFENMSAAERHEKMVEDLIKYIKDGETNSESIAMKQAFGATS